MRRKTPTEKTEETDKQPSMSKSGQLAVLVEKREATENTPNTEAKEAKENLTQIEAEESEPTFKVLDCRRRKKIERGLPLSLGVKDWTEEIKPLKMSAGELEELGVKHEWHDTSDTGDFGEKLIRHILNKLYELRESSPKLYNFVKADKRDQRLDLLMEDSDNNCWLIEVKTAINREAFSYRWKEVVSLLEGREKALLNEIPALNGRVKKLLVHADFRPMRARYLHSYPELSNRGINIIEIRPLSSYQYPTKSKQALEYSLRGMSEEEIAKKLHVTIGTVRSFIFRAKNPEHYKKRVRKYYLTYKNRLRKTI